MIKTEFDLWFKFIQMQFFPLLVRNNMTRVLLLIYTVLLTEESRKFLLNYLIKMQHTHTFCLSIYSFSPSYVIAYSFRSLTMSSIQLIDKRNSGGSGGGDSSWILYMTSIVTISWISLRIISKLSDSCVLFVQINILLLNIPTKYFVEFYE